MIQLNNKNKEHTSVLLGEVLQYLQPFEAGYYIDATFGAGGYSRAILDAHAGAKVIAFDKDPSVQVFADELSTQYSNRFEFIHSSYDKIGDELMARCIAASGIVYDLGVSSMQLDNKGRGFSFEGDDLLDMRMDTTQTLSAFDVVNQYDERKLADVIYQYGDEHKSRAIAKRIVDFRTHNDQINTTKQLADIICSVVRRKGKIHPATKTFQAIRIEVNDELNQLKTSITSALPYVKIDGKMVVVTFHSGEDRIVKRIFNENTTISRKNFDGLHGYFERHLPMMESELDSEGIETTPSFKKLNKKVVVPTSAEISSNIRARSAKLRAIVKVKDEV